MRKVRCNLKAILEERGMEQKELAQITGIREATISELCRDINKMFPRTVIDKIADALQIDDLNLLISIQNEKDGNRSE
ncbi:helix-turn-helix transcriptional regulator [Paenibacillus ehimensis]|uniref:helix-turn-helix domain-containing protein n=1 Tax=Paenibacillus ehimensis TaxID=79264 RepID=UPI00047213A0|nr:helix-turn-helix transcriptional regulator [Paenibacillus ehimensis]MEC0209545.1 helix-turn-helix transcriptional regulator [Paenibacillus ehimensis]